MKDASHSLTMHKSARCLGWARPNRDSHVASFHLLPVGALLGGSFGGGLRAQAGSQRCDEDASLARNSSQVYLGFRCCAD